MFDTGAFEVPYFDNARVSIDFYEDYPDRRLVQVLEAFLERTSDDRRQDARHLLAYCKGMIDSYDRAEELLESLGGTMPTLATIWDFAEPSGSFVCKRPTGEYNEQDTLFLCVVGRVPWEDEHGLLMSWEEGRTLVKVGPFDNEPTNGTGNDQFVYCHDGFSTLRG